MLDRQTQPLIKPIGELILPEIKFRLLPNGIPLYLIPLGEEEVTRTDIMVTAGRYHQETALEASLTNALLKEGSSSHTSAALAEKLDYLGAWLQPSVTFHNSYVTLYSLNKHAGEALPLLEEIIKNPLFPEKEFQTLLNQRKQLYLIEREKVQSLAANAFSEALFGTDHPYGKTLQEEDFERITTHELKAFHREYYRPENMKIVITGKITEEIENRIARSFGEPFGSAGRKKNFSPPLLSPGPVKEILIEKEDALQSAIRIGLPLVKREHPDYMGLRILNTVLGGYFGSRLMTRIREEKGYTYGIHSSLTSQPQATTLSISTQTGIEYTQPLIREVYREIEKLRNEPIEEKELNLVKNYMTGELARLVDGAFSVADAYLSLLANQLPFDYYNRQAEIIRKATSSQLQELADRYFRRENFYTVIAGKKG